MKQMKQITMRDFQHNLSSYMDLSSSIPIIVSKQGVPKAIIADPSQFEIKKRVITKKTSKKELLKSPFVGMYKNRSSWKTLSSADIALTLREKAWDGK